ncbi:hypothetical protein PsYK624_092320 [Phanerochaete sordida]|uniref:DUF6534 domain-containing protein n=1 Tax=Phanerochaete sordida TaxID=48140 RepID=A0A9P3LFU9_9APHY|nr:hypothetical protein PsYK624_092320 [Phanerochaete sordida]
MQPIIPLLPQPSLQYQVGAALMLVCVTFMLFGTLTTQAYFYAHTYKSDHYALRIFVAGIWVLEIIHTAFCLHFVYVYFVLDLDDPLELLIIPWSIGGSLLLELGIIGICQGFYLLRLWRLSNRNLIVVGIPSILLLAHLAGGFASLAYMPILKTWPAFNAHRASQILIYVSLSLSAFVDTQLVVLVIFYLRKHMARFRRSRGTLQTLTFLTVGTGAITIIGSLSVILLFAFMHNSLTYGAMMQIMSKLYGNSVFGFLNARQHLRSCMQADAAESVPVRLTDAQNRSDDKEQVYRSDVYAK